MPITFQKRFVSHYLPVFFWCSLIFFFSSQSSLPKADTPTLEFLFKKGAHVFVYAVLYFLLFRAMNVGKEKQRFLLPLILCVVYAISDEIHQRFTPGRGSHWYDVMIDTVGMLIVMSQGKKLSRFL